MNTNFVVELCSDLDYEEMVVYLSWKHVPLAILSCEEGRENVQIEMVLNSEEIQGLRIPVGDFLEALSFARKTLVGSEKFSD